MFRILRQRVFPQDPCYWYIFAGSSLARTKGSHIRMLYQNCYSGCFEQTKIPKSRYWFQSYGLVSTYRACTYVYYQYHN